MALKLWGRRLNDLPLDADFSAVVLSSFRKSGVVSQLTMQDIVTAHGWAGEMDFAACHTVLHDVMCDDRSEEVFFPVREFVQGSLY